MSHRPTNAAILCTCWLALILPAAPARAYLRALPEDTIEWTVADSDAVVTGVVEELGIVATDKLSFFKITIGITETIKPAVPGGVPVLAGKRLTISAGSQPPIAVGEPYAFFLVSTDRYLKAQSPLPAGVTAAYKLYPYSLRWHWNSAPLPLNARPDGPVELVDLSGRRIPLADTLARLRAEAARPTARHAGAHELIISPTSQAFPQGNERRPTPYVTILVDERAEARAREWVRSADACDRWNGATVLSRLKSDANADVLRELMADPFVTTDGFWPGGSDFVWPPGEGKWRVSVYPIRQAAYAALNTWGMAPAEAILTAPEYPPAYVPRWTPVAVAGGLGVVLLIVVGRGWTYRRRARCRPTPATEADSDTLDPVRRPLLAGMSGACLILLGLSVGLLILSLFRATELAWPAKPGVRYELSALAGHLRLVRNERGEPPAPVAVTCVARDAAGKVDADWQFPTATNPFTGAAGAPADHRRLGFRHQTGAMPADGFGVSAYRAWSAPLWVLCAVLAIPPGVRIWRRFRNRGHDQRGCCPACGYDLRATPQRCPECGAEVPSRAA